MGDVGGYLQVVAGQHETALYGRLVGRLDRHGELQTRIDSASTAGTGQSVAAQDAQGRSIDDSENVGQRAPCFHAGDNDSRLQQVGNLHVGPGNLQAWQALQATPRTTHLQALAIEHQFAMHLGQHRPRQRVGALVSRRHVSHDSVPDIGPDGELPQLRVGKRHVPQVTLDAEPDVR